MEMKKILLNTVLFCMTVFTGGCSDFFEVNTDNTLNDEDYITEESEAFTGYMGIITKLQAIGDKAIYLNELRGELIEPTSNAPRELISIYNYDTDLTGNSYADPAGYYEVINACNDYLSKLKAYKESYRLDETYYKPLRSGALRIKVWTFMMIAKLYGSVIWIDKPMTSLEDLNQFEVKDLDNTMKACKSLLDSGFDGVEASYEADWETWLDPTTAGQATSPYRQWKYMTPPAYILYAEIYLWLGEYQNCIDQIQGFLNDYRYTSSLSDYTYIRGLMLFGKYSSFWDESQDYFYREAISAIMYHDKMGGNYSISQTNHLLQHFDNDYPNKYWLAPSEIGRARFLDTEFAPLGGANDEDWRHDCTFKQQNGNWVIHKFKQDASKLPYEDDVLVYMYRGADLYFMMAEAFNQLGKKEVVDALINRGIESYVDRFNVDEDGVYSGEWEGFTPCWTDMKTYYYRESEPKNRGYQYRDDGLRGSSGQGFYEFTDDKLQNEELILREMMLEEACEGKVYPTMIRMARRNKDASIMAKYVGEKYEGKGNAEAIRAKIMNGEYFIHWDLKKGTE